MELITIRFDSDIGTKTVKIHPRKVIATDILEADYGEGVFSHQLSIMLEGGHNISMALSSYQNCIDIEQDIWGKIEGVLESDEVLEQRVPQEA